MKQKKWNSDYIFDQKGKTIIVTGSSSGIGFEAARILALKNGEVIIAVRNPEKGGKAVEKIISEILFFTINVSVNDFLPKTGTPFIFSPIFFYHNSTFKG